MARTIARAVCSTDTFHPSCVTAAVVINEGVCHRTALIRDELRGSGHCADITPADLADRYILRLERRKLGGPAAGRRPVRFDRHGSVSARSHRLYGAVAVAACRGCRCENQIRTAGRQLSVLRDVVERWRREQLHPIFPDGKPLHIHAVRRGKPGGVLVLPARWVWSESAPGVGGPRGAERTCWRPTSRWTRVCSC